MRSFVATFLLCFLCLPCNQTIADDFGYSLFRPYREIPILKVNVIKSFPHSTSAFTQGLVFHDGFLYESTGRYGRSQLRKINPETGAVLQRVKLSGSVFGEGLAVSGDNLVVLSWKQGRVFFFDTDTMELGREIKVAFPECWGLALMPDGRLIMGGGGARLDIVSPDDFSLISSIEVREADVPVSRINELEFVGKVLLANVWRLFYVAVIEPSSGVVLAWIDFFPVAGLISVGHDGEEVLNGIAWDPDGKRLFITGKNWPEIFVVEVDGLEALAS